MTERIEEPALASRATGRDIDTKYAEIVGESGLKGKEGVYTDEGVVHKEKSTGTGMLGGILGSGKKEEHGVTLPRETSGLREGETTTSTLGTSGTTSATTGTHKGEGFLDKIKEAFTGKPSTTTTGTLTEEELAMRERGGVTSEHVLHERDYGETRSRVIDERDIDTHKTREKVIEEKDIVAPVEHRRVVEQKHPREHIRVIEEITRIKLPTLGAADRRKIVDTREDRKPIQRRVVREEQVRAAVEKRKVIEEVWASESVVVFEEKAPIREGVIGSAVKHEVKSEVTGAGVSHGKYTYKGSPTHTKVLDEYTVDGVIENKRVIEEIEVIEVHRFIEEREPLAKPLIDEEFIKKRHAARKY